MTTLQLILLSFIQGITEFLPISSSGHLIIIPKLIGLEDQGLVMDVAVHLGTLLAVIIYFWRDIYRLLFSVVKIFLNTKSQSGVNSDFLLLIKLLISSLPVMFMGFLLSKYLWNLYEDLMRQKLLIVCLYFMDFQEIQRLQSKVD